MTTKQELYNRVVKELNLDVDDPFTNLMAHAFALVEQRDEQRIKLRHTGEKVELIRAEARILLDRLLDGRHVDRIDLSNLHFHLEQLQEWLES